MSTFGYSFGVKKGNSEFLDSQMRFFKEQMIPSLKKQKIKHVYFLGDVMDNRNHINVRILYAHEFLMGYSISGYALITPAGVYFQSVLRPGVRATRVGASNSPSSNNRSPYLITISGKYSAFFAV